MKLEAGKYWVGDPCYVLDEDHGINFNWHEFCDFVFDGDPSGRAHEGVVDHQGIKFAFHGTEYGDGGYYDQYGNEYGVDAGMLGCVPYDVISKYISDKDLNRMGKVHEFKRDFDTGYRCGGTLRFGHILIETGDEDECDDNW